MKTLLTFLLTLALTAGLAQQVHRVNNNAGISGTRVYSTFAAAHTAAAANDIIIVEPSSVSYGTVTITKPLKIYGNGYHLTTNTSLKADPRNSTFDNVEFNTGSGGSEIYGITSGSISVYGVSNITISRNYVSNIYYTTQNKAGTTQTSISNLVLSRNHIVSTISHTGSLSGTVSNVLVNNNILNWMTASNDPVIQSWVVRNNTFTSAAANLSLVNSVLENNFFAAAGSSPSLGNVTWSYNVSTGNTFSGGIGNVNNYDVVTNSELVGTGSGISPDRQYQVKDGSPLKTMGNGGIEVGAYGGNTPYVISGIPPIPSVVSMVNSGTGDNTNPVKVTITVKSNN